MNADTLAPADLAMLQQIHRAASTGRALHLAALEATLPGDEMAIVDRLRADGYIAYLGATSTGPIRVSLTLTGRQVLDRARAAAELRDVEDRAVAAAARLDPADDSERARFLREYAANVRDHRDMAARRAAWQH